MQHRALLTAVALAAAIHPLAAQEWNEPADSSRAGWSLERTMREFTRTLPGEPIGYFPSRGVWTHVETRVYPDGRTRRSIERIPAEQTKAALSPGGPMCPSFHWGDAGFVGTVGDAGISEPGLWHRVRGTRFGPRGIADPDIYIEWRREDGRWVISEYGEEAEYQPHLAGREVRSTGPSAAVPLRLPLPEDAQVAAGADWFVRDDPIVVYGHRLPKYGLPRRLNEGDVVRFATFQGVGLYMEPQITGMPEVVYVPVDREGNFQPYQNESGTGCET
jgi:hypothetical protein